MEAYVEAAITAGLAEMGFSDHMPFMLQPRQKLAQAWDEVPLYVDAVRRLGECYGDRITIRLGAEVDYVPGREQETAAFIERYDFDYVLGSVHFIGEWGFDDPAEVDRYEDWSLCEVYERYFELVVAGAQTGLFTTMSHLDLPKKHGRKRSDEAYPALMEEVAAALAEAGVAFEVNASGLFMPIGELYPEQVFVNALHAAGVPATLGSDSHAPSHVGRGLDDAIASLTQAGYTSVATFAGRTRQLSPLPESVGEPARTDSDA
jgi:histidinol-phosphatase (PHP family)